MKLKIILDDMHEFGDLKKATKLVQERLNKVGGESLKLDGAYGPKTDAALKRFQKGKLGLNGSGIMGVKTLEGLFITPAVDLKPRAISVKDSEQPTNVISLATYAQKRILLIGQAELGVREVPGRGDNPRVVLYHKFSTKNNDKGSPDSVPWCASVQCFILEMAGLKSTDSKMARSFERGGYKNVTANPLPGDTITFYRNGRKSGSGHVGIYLGQDSKYYYVMGGNQSDAYNVKKFSKKATSSTGVTGIWRTHNERISKAQVAELELLATKIRAGEKIALAGSVV